MLNLFHNTVHVENYDCLAHWDKKMRLLGTNGDGQGGSCGPGNTWGSQRSSSPITSVTHTACEDTPDKPRNLRDEENQASKGGWTPERLTKSLSGRARIGFSQVSYEQ